MIWFISRQIWPTQHQQWRQKIRLQASFSRHFWNFESENFAPCATKHSWKSKLQPALVQREMINWESASLNVRVHTLVCPIIGAITVQIVCIAIFCYSNIVGPYHNAPLFLDCCALVRQCVNDLKEEFGFTLGPWNQAYQVKIVTILLLFNLASLIPCPIANRPIRIWYLAI